MNTPATQLFSASSQFGFCMPHPNLDRAPHKLAPSKVHASESPAQEANAAKAYTAQLAAEEACEESGTELEALRALYAQDVGGLEEDLFELQSQFKKLKEGGEGSGGGGGGDGGGGGGSGAAAARIEKLEEQLASMSEDLAGALDREARASASASDLGEELAAVRELARMEEEARLAELDEMRERVIRAEKGLAGAGGEGGQADADAATIEALRGQVAALIEAYEAQESAAAELMVLRPKMALLEQELAETRDAA